MQELLGNYKGFNGKLRDKLLNHEWFRSGAAAKILIERWRQFYSEQRPHSAHGEKAPATVRRARLEADCTDLGITGRLATESVRRSVRWADAPMVCAAHSAVRTLAPGGFREEVEAALDSVSGTLERHRKQYG